jgi:hypothetical protein
MKNNKNYDYLSNDPNINFLDGVAFLKKTIKNNIYTGWIPHTNEENIKIVIEDLKKYGIKISETCIDVAKYQQYLRAVDYPQNYPGYYSGNLPEKSLEHFLSLTYLDLKKGERFVDIANEHAPVPTIFNKITGCESYSQDIMFTSGINGHIIGCNASSIPTENCFFSAATALCSIEHFEGNDDVLFIKEIVRVLKSKGKIIITPLYMFSRPSIQTDPKYSIAGGVVFDDNADIYCADGWGNRFGRQYSPSTLYSRIIQPNHDTMDFEIIYLKNTNEIDKTVYCRFILVGTKK